MPVGSVRTLARECNEEIIRVVYPLEVGRGFDALSMLIIICYCSRSKVAPMGELVERNRPFGDV
jgi:hypothetical protein